MESAPRSLIERLKRRKVVQWTVAYLSAAWLMLQVVNVIGHQFSWPLALSRAITVALAFGLMAAVIVAWYHGERGHQRITRTETLLLAAVAFVAMGALVGTVRTTPAGPAILDAPVDRGGATVPVDPLAIAVLPFVSASPDPELERLGRELAVTLTATLDGIDDLRLVDGLTILAQAPAGTDPVAMDDALALASRVGAGRLLRGSLARVDRGLRADIALLPTDGSGRPTRLSVSVPGEPDLAVLTDSVALAVLGRLWRRSTPELPSPAALDTRSADALRSYVEGEEALARAEMDAAVAAFERAFAQDTTYWFAYWRSLYPRVYEGAPPPDRDVVARMVEQRHTFPLPDRRLVDAQLASTLSEQLAILERATRQSPTHWPTWYAYANLLIHDTPYLGTEYASARSALERVLALHPTFAAAWEHLFWIVSLQRDTARTRQVLARMEEFGGTGAIRFDDARLRYYRAVARLARSGDRPDPEAEADDARFLAQSPAAPPPRISAVGLLTSGLPRGQAGTNDAILALGPPAATAAVMWMGKAYAWAARGAWDSTTVAVDRWTRMDGSWDEALAGYGLLAAGAALGALDAGTAAERRPGEPPAAARPLQLAELAWLDGIVAFARGDAAGLARARRGTAAVRDRVPLPDESLAAMEAYLEGRADRAVETLLAAEDGAADLRQYRQLARATPYLFAVNRVLLGRWLLAAGRPADARRALSWYETILPGIPPVDIVNRSVGVLGIYERALAEDAMGRVDDALDHYLLFLDLMDRPLPSLQPLVEDARSRVASLGGASR